MSDYSIDSLTIDGFNGVVKATAGVISDAATTTDLPDSPDKRYVTDAQSTVIGNTSGTNTGDQTTIVGITGTFAQFNTAVTDAELARTDAANTFTGVQTFSTPIDTGSIATMTATIGGGVPTPPNNTTTFLRGDGTFATPPTGGGSEITATTTWTFLNEEDTVVNTIANATLTSALFKSFTIIPIETTATSLDDFKLNGVTFNIENIIDNTSFDIRATAVNNATGVYTATYKIIYS